MKLSPEVYVDVLGDLQRRYGVRINYEDVLEQNYRRFVRPGSTVVDVGAHTGRHLKILTELVGPSGLVIGFEPLPAQAEQLRRFAEGRGNVRIYEVALQDKKERTSFIHAVGTPEESGLKQRTYNFPERASPDEISVDADMLDSIAEHLPRLDYIKIDIEGAELLCLHGARDAIQRFKPIISVEYGQRGYGAYGFSSAELFEFAEEQGLSLFDIFGHEIQTRETWEAVCNTVYWDYFLVPKTRTGEFRAALARACRPNSE